jgi:hypothetical protein
MSSWSYEDFIRVFEEIAQTQQLWKQPPRNDGKPETMFKL